MKIEEVTAPPAPVPDHPEIPNPPPPLREPDCDEVEYLAWRQELL